MDFTLCLLQDLLMIVFMMACHYTLNIRLSQGDVSRKLGRTENAGRNSVGDYNNKIWHSQS